MANEANLISAKLQNLLNIPPIQRQVEHENLGSSRFAGGSGDASNLILGSNRNENAFNNIPPPERGRGEQHFDDSNQGWDVQNIFSTEKNKSSNSKPDQQPRTPDRPKIFRPSVPSAAATPSPPRRGGSNERRNTSQQEYSPRYIKSNTRNTNLLMSSLDSSACPRNLIDIRQQLLRVCVEEQKPIPLSFVDEDVARALGSHCIQPLQKKSVKFPRARYFCDICNYHMDNVTNAVNHIMNTRHITNEQVWALDKGITKIPAPSRFHELNLQSLLLEIATKYGIDDMTEKPLRQGIVQRLIDVLRGYAWLHLELFGSSLSGFGFTTSDVNINIDLTKLVIGNTEVVMSKEEQGKFITNLGTTLKSLTGIENVRQDFKYMQLKFFEAIAQRECVIHLNNTSGVLTAQLFAEYDKLDPRVRPLVIAFRRWAQLTEVDQQDKGLFPSHSFTIMVLKHLQDVGVIPILTKPTEGSERREFFSAVEAQKSWRTQNIDNIGKLWVDILRKYAFEFPMKELVISICADVVLKKADRIWNRKISIEDPIICKSNLTRAVCSNRICDYVCDRIKYAYHYFAIPRMVGGIPLYNDVIPLDHVNPERIYVFGKPKPVAVVAPVQTLQTGDQARQVIPQRQVKTMHGEDNTLPRIRMTNIPDYRGDMRVHVVQEDINLIHQVLSASEYCYEFSQWIFQAGEKPPLICKSCGGDGHLKSDCPEEKLSKSSRLPPGSLDLFTDSVLSQVIVRNFNAQSLAEFDIKLRHDILSDISQALLSCFPDAMLNLFGSSYNGFGLKHSDVDICLRFGKNPLMKADYQSERASNLLRTIVEKLKDSGTMTEILAIPSAKVPIVKFKHRASKLEGDISLSNRLAIRNTALLRCYTEIDPRLKVLGCFMKTVTKLCEISDASKGSLSSYAYILMLIHFCQQHEPPVLPVLQELPFSNADRDNVDGVDASFFSDLSQLSRVWRGYRSNNESVAQLFLSFLNYYSSKFDFDTQVVTIRQFEPMSRESKLWLSDTAIAIEDPFDHSHNLGAGLSRRMGVYIVRCIQRYRDFFSCTIEQMNKNTDFVAHYLDPRRLRLAYDPPVDRQCRICNRIGHIAKTCTFAPKNDDGSLLYVQDDDGDERFPLNKFGDESESPPSAPRKTFNITTKADTSTVNTATSPRIQERGPVIAQKSQSDRDFERTADSLFSGAAVEVDSEWLNAVQENPVRSNSSEIDPEHLRKLQEGIMALMNLGGASSNEIPTTSSNGLQFFGGQDDAPGETDRLNAMIQRNPGVVFQLGGNGQRSPSFSGKSGPFNVADDPELFQNQAAIPARSPFEPLSEVTSDPEDSILSQMMQTSANPGFGYPQSGHPFDRDMRQPEPQHRIIGPPPGYPPVATVAAGFSPFQPPVYGNPPPGYAPIMPCLGPAPLRLERNPITGAMQEMMPIITSADFQRLPAIPITSINQLFPVPLPIRDGYGGGMHPDFHRRVFMENSPPLTASNFFNRSEIPRQSYGYPALSQMPQGYLQPSNPAAFQRVEESQSNLERDSPQVPAANSTEELESERERQQEREEERQQERDQEQEQERPNEFANQVTGQMGHHAPVFVMGPSGQMLNHNYSDMTSHSYHLSHIHHGPMVSAVPVGMSPNSGNIQSFPMGMPPNTGNIQSFPMGMPPNTGNIQSFPMGMGSGHVQSFLGGMPPISGNNQSYPGVTTQNPINIQPTLMRMPPSTGQVQSFPMGIGMPQNSGNIQSIPPGMPPNSGIVNSFQGGMPPNTGNIQSVSPGMPANSGIVQSLPGGMTSNSGNIQSNTPLSMPPNSGIVHSFFGGMPPNTGSIQSFAGGAPTNSLNFQSIPIGMPPISGHIPVFPVGLTPISGNTPTFPLQHSQAYVNNAFHMQQQMAQQQMVQQQMAQQQFYHQMMLQRQHEYNNAMMQHHQQSQMQGHPGNESDSGQENSNQGIPQSGNPENQE